ncbi:Anti-sigma-K factor RskA [Blastococcus aurantiacus]|uniref:Regulator of SigK n=1 Tax=Blastococcus aurantiacus TaxID=1550231 RepID=A0A1G7HBR3_9ACTN|nr:anti-sigma factor [Blastococcus aurantiacus]SDE97753.1 Anti-sigma-K factor RskA [Blastococcus aurantiacus]
MSTTRPGPGHDEGFEELAVGWALHALEPEDADAFLPHLADCARCRQVVDDTTEVMADLATATPSAEPPPGLGERLRAEVARTPQDGSAELPVTAAPRTAARPAPPAPEPAPVAVPVPRRRWTSVLVAAAVAAVVGLGGWTVVLVDDRNEARDAAAAEAAMLEELLRPGPATVVPVAGDDGRTVATLLARDDGVQVVSHALEPNDRDAENYVLWGLEQGTPKALGTFDVAGSGLELSTLEVEGADDFPSYGLTVEPGDTAPEAPTTDVVARGSLPS